MTTAQTPDAGAIERAEVLLRAAGGERVRTVFELAPLTTFRIGGPARLYLEPESTSDLEAAAQAVNETGIAWTVIGKGSNILVADAGFDGLVLRLGKGFRWTGRDGAALTAGGAMPVPALAGVAATHVLSGLEFGVAIPASLGGSVRMNAGAHGRAIGDVVAQVQVFSMSDATTKHLSREEAGFEYRSSNLGGDAVVIGATLSLAPGEPGEIRELMNEAREWRRATQPLAEPNCGSVFKNPPNEHAARLVEESGAKGLAVGGAHVSDKHANFIVADPGTTARDVISLIQAVTDRVQDRFGIELEREVRFVGDIETQARR
jgi:UDP-N-acetylmuramate dehydrogenase